MHRIDSKRVQGAASASAILALLLIICLAECATEQRVNRIGSKSAGLYEKVNGWRSQRGGSCLSYGHSCWGAHGKRSAKPPTAAPDWYLTRLLRHMAVNAEMNRARQEPTNDDINAIFQMDVQDDSQPNRLMSVNEDPAAMGPMKPEAIPMLDDDLLSKMKLWKIMRNAADEK
ncbi:uncharacterized protein LOC125240394 isoform X1 [Leguminivora glycinivorella]|uniref:uncharacterized protein LOC125240394 isoform X1 n=1 Tax=Leguminivora glycinivorella TaxID=1035111 RepID=UPI00201069C8|nr:uncharacterized protein LOC125240394 isoform X1 [Leguminivora glycinivorella]XP_048004249.1 uncharacterized protein LOC125240394 isoform X1 [Leguminivora glycinivorella]